MGDMEVELKTSDPPLVRLRYALFKRVEALGDMRAAFSVYVRRRGMESVQDEERDKEMVQTLLDLKKKLDSIIKDAFDGNESFDRTLRDAFEHFINCRENRPAQLIAKFMDLHLRAGNKVLICNFDAVEVVDVERDCRPRVKTQQRRYWTRLWCCFAS